LLSFSFVVQNCSQELNEEETKNTFSLFCDAAQHVANKFLSKSHSTMGEYESDVSHSREKVVHAREREFSERMRALGKFTASDRERISITFLIMYDFARVARTCALL
jgi:hypothetical protein